MAAELLMSDKTDLVHKIGAQRIHSRRLTVDMRETKVELVDVGERMSRKHCFISGRQVYHISIIDFL